MNNKSTFSFLTLLLLFVVKVNFGQVITLGTASDFVLFTSNGAVTNAGISQITGNIGADIGSITGFGNVNGVIQNNNGITALCASDLLTAYGQLNTATPGFFPSSPLGNTSTLTAGVYSLSANTVLNDTLTLDAAGISSAVFIFQINGTFSSNSNSVVRLINAALSCNVYWKVEGAVGLSNGTEFKGTIVANNAAISISSGVTLDGRALSTTGAVSVSNVLAYTPLGCGSPFLTGPTAPILASTASYALFSSDGAVSNAGATTVTGDIGSNNGSAVGFNPLLVTGLIHPIPDLSTGVCAIDLANIYTYLNTLSPDILLLFPAQFGNNLVLTPHTYIMNGAVTLTDSLYLDAMGNANAVFVIQVNGAFSTSVNSKIILLNGAQSKNVYWKIDGALSINDNSIFRGTAIVNNAAIVMTNGVILDGRALTTTGALSTLGVTVTIPPSGHIKTTIVNGSWSNSNIWSPVGIPASTDKIFIYHSVKLDQSITQLDTIFIFDVLSINTGVVLTLGNPGTLILVNTSIHNGRIGEVQKGGNIIGSYTFQKWITRCDQSSTYGSPFTVPKTDFNWFHCYQCMGPGWSNLYYYDESNVGILDSGYYDNIGANLMRGKGFFYWYANYAGGLNFPRQISIEGSTDFTTAFDFNVTHTTGSGASHDGFNLLSNPFPGTMDWLSGSWTKSSVHDAIYVWSTCSGSYASFVGGVGVNGGSRYIPSLQGFWVQTNNSSPSLIVQSGALVTDSLDLLKSNLSANTVNYVLRLELNGDEIAIRLDPNSTIHNDSLSDALKFITSESKLLSYNYLDSIMYSINSIKDTNSVIPIKIKGGGTLVFTGVNTFFNQYAIYLKDLVSNQNQVITEGMNYTFSDSSLISFNKRFEVHFVNTNPVAIKNQSLVKGDITYDSETIRIRLSNEFQLPVTIKLYDLSGMEIYSGKFDQNEIDILKKGFPVVLIVYNKNERLVKKIF